MTIKLIVSDIDGCLTPELAQPWAPNHFLPLLNFLAENRVGANPLPPITFATGRPQPYTEALAKLLAITETMICENGAVFYRLAGDHAWHPPYVAPTEILALRDVRNWVQAELLPSHPNVRVQFGKEAHLSLGGPAGWNVELFHHAIDEYARRKHGLSLAIHPSQYYLNISLPAIDKGRAVQWLAANEWKLERSEIAAIGDTVGDLPLRSAAGFFACPANSHAVVKAAADYVSPYSELQGVIDILKKIGSIANPTQCNRVTR